MKFTFSRLYALLFVAIAAALPLQAAKHEQSQLDKAFFTSCDIGLNIIDEDLFFLALLEQGFSFGGFELSLLGPLRLRIIDNTPEENRVLRNQDWDESSDYARIVRHIRYAKTWDNNRVDVYMGELNGVHMGHGELVSHYFNSTDMDHYQGGLLGYFSIDGNGLELMATNVIKPDIFSARVHLSPISWFSSHPWATRLELGGSLFIDNGVPSRTLHLENNNIVAGGGDLSVAIVNSSTINITPYLAINAMDGDAGIHVGARTEIQLSRAKQTKISLQSEYRRVGADYYPALANPFYDHNRRFFTQDETTNTPNTFADHLANPSSKNSVANSFMLELEILMGEQFRAGIRYDYQSQQRPHWVLAKVELVPTKNISIRAFFAGQDIEGGKQIWSKDALIGLSYHHQIVGPLRAFTEFSRRFRRIDDDTTSFANEFSAAGGIVFSY